MSFRQHLEEVCSAVDGALACSLMGLDGIEVETHRAEPEPGVDLEKMLVEYANVFQGARQAAEALSAGGVDEVSIHAGRLVTVARLVSPEYILLAALTPEANLGKARYLLRITAPKVLSEL